MKPKVYPALTRCVEEGVLTGHQRAFKHSDSPSKEYLQECTISAVMGEISEWFDFEDDIEA